MFAQHFDHSPFLSGVFGIVGYWPLVLSIGLLEYGAEFIGFDFVGAEDAEVFRVFFDDVAEEERSGFHAAAD